ncbi:MAG TPA: hypothetical protein VFQ48_03530 [Pseudonocardiaceae bacterium]|jgi:hypothetical protein|nr:hypothetical protein [Pseudonocardiaceae bacterium]
MQIEITTVEISVNGSKQGHHFGLGDHLQQLQRAGRSQDSEDHRGEQVDQAPAR